MLSCTFEDIKDEYRRAVCNEQRYYPSDGTAHSEVAC